MQDTTPAKSRGGKFLTFFLAGEEYGLEILKVQEIIGLMKITAVPRTPDYLKGVINLRGRVIPVIDLRVKFSLPPAERTAQNCVIVVCVKGVETGLLVDRVSDVCHLPDEAVSPPIELGAGVRHDLILGLGKADDGVKILLDLDGVLSTEDAVELRRAEAPA